MSNDKRKRVFWLGMHVVLTKTELPRLRELGYEVFNPPYLSDIYDQSATTSWDRDQQSTLPREVFQELSQFGFFYNNIPPRIAELLNEYFGTVIVTCNALWLHSVLGAFKGRIIYRVFGQATRQSDVLCAVQLFRSIQEHDDFHFVPHADEAVRDDHSWLKTRMSIVPYTIPLDTFEHQNTWSPAAPYDRQIMACCPNVENPYYMQQYHYLNTSFPDPYIRLYGVQPKRHADPRVVGTLTREELLHRYRVSAGYWYHYPEPCVCYLPPIEMMTIGGPVVYMRGSLLATYFNGRGPGEAADVDDAKRKLRWLLDGDQGFINEVRASQGPVVRRYHPDHVQPIFDETFRRLIDGPDAPQQEPVVVRIGEPRGPRKRAYVFCHAPGTHVVLDQGQYEAVDELGQTTASVASKLLEDTDLEVVVTCFADQIQFLYGLLKAEDYPGRLRFHVLDHERLVPIAYKWLEDMLSPFRVQRVVELPPPPATDAVVTPVSAPAPPTTRKQKILDRVWNAGLSVVAVVGRSRIALRLLLVVAIFSHQMFTAAKGRYAWLAMKKAQARASYVARKARMLTALAPYKRALKSPNAAVRRRDCVDELNREHEETVVIVPHNHLFPEALFLNKPIILCLPPTPPPAGLTGFRSKINARIARSLQAKAAAVCTAAEFSASQVFAARKPVRKPAASRAEPEHERTAA